LSQFLQIKPNFYLNFKSCEDLS